MHTRPSLHPSILITPFYASMLASSDSQVSRWIFHFVLIYVAYRLWHARQQLLTTFNSSTLLGITLIIYAMLSVFWGETENIGSYLRWGVGLIFFWLSLALIAQSDKERIKQTAMHLCIATLVVCLYTIAHYFIASDSPSRNMGPGIISHPIMGPSILICVSASSIMLLQVFDRFPVALAASLFLCLFIYTLTTGSRGPLLSLAAWGAALCLTAPIKTKIKVIAVAFFVTLMVILYFSIPSFFHKLIERGSTYRVDIWTATINTLDNALLFGRGIDLKFADTEISKSLFPITGIHIQHPHNLGLSTWLYCGLTGVILLFITTISGAWSIMKKNKKAFFAATPVIVVAFFLSLTDLSKIIAPPSAIWFIFWLPFGLISGISTRKSISKTSHNHSGS